jgi:hypothetical protein
LVGLVPRIQGATVFDPAAGEGALLKAFVDVMPDAAVIAADSDRAAVRALRMQHPTWRLGAADAVSERSRAASAPWRIARSRGVDVVLLNPPFSFRGYGGAVVDFAGSRYRATPAVAFVATALEQVGPRVGVYAVLPRGAMGGERDRKLWSAIAAAWDVRVHAELPRGSFPSVTATTVLVSVVPAMTGPRPIAAEVQTTTSTGGRGCSCVEIVRGRIPASSAKSAGAGLTPWLHTSDVHDFQATVRWVDLPRTLTTPGPMLVLPRVGKFDARKLAVVHRSAIALSDCLYGLRLPEGHFDELLRLLRDDANRLSSLYFGTGAPHLTIARLAGYLRDLGLVARHVSAASEPLVCQCSTNTSTMASGLNRG